MDRPRTCIDCRYALAGLPAGRCPECGRWFDPADPTSFLESRHGFWRSLAAVAPNRWGVIAYAAVVIPAFVSLCSPNGSVSDASGLLLFALWAVSIILWTPLFLVHLIGRMALLLVRAPQPRWRWSWVIALAAFASCAALQQSGLLWRARWALARPAFTSAISAPTPPPAPCWIGTFYVDSWEASASGAVAFKLGFTDPYSDGPATIMYSPSGPPWGAPIVIDLCNGWWVLFDHT